MDEENAQLTELLGKAANGQTLVALYNLIKAWVLKQLESSGEKLDEESVKTIVNNILATTDFLTEDEATTIVNNILAASDFITEDEATTIVNNAITSAGSITEERVQEMIDESVGAAIATAY